MRSEGNAKSDAFYRAIGRFVFEFSQLEYALSFHLTQAINLHDQFFEPVMSAFDFAKLCGTVEAVCSPTLTSDQQKKLRSVINDCRKLNEERVRIVHGLWNIGAGFGRLHSLSRSSLKRTTHYEDPAEIERQAEKAAHLRTEITNVIHSLPEIERRMRK